ncbi:MAG TPA: hypothetical protein VFE70_00515 [Candidatus Elarobacter sp.]|nr:hypothetical protein [Candidatus Elarobacter sp.]
MIVAVQLLAASIALLMVLVAMPAPAPAPATNPTPFPIGSLEPFGSTPAPLTNLPNIGRVRSTTAACAAMRDLIIPSFTAARKADVRFAQTQIRLPQYADLVDDELKREPIYRETALARIDDDAMALLDQTLVLNRALGDPRLSPKSTDPDIVAERAALERLYEAQKSRADLLNEFVIRQRAAIATAGIDTTTKDYAKTQAQQTPAPIPIPNLTAPPGMPLFTGSDMGDKNNVRTWGNNMTAHVRYNENIAAKTFLPIAQRCR